MSKFLLSIELGNDAMQTGNDIAKALHTVGLQINSNDQPYPTQRPIRDVNGNIVGQWQVI